MARLFARITVLVLGLFAFAGAQAQTYTYTFYVGNTNATGCTVATAAGPVDHVKWRLQATVTAGVTPQFGSVTRADCSNDVFGSPSAVSSTSAIGLNTGTGGADVIEVQLPIGAVGPTPSPREVLAVVASSNSASDALISTTGSTKGVIAPSPTPALIPSLGLIGLVVLGLVLIGAGWYVLRRHPYILPLSLLLVAGTAWAVTIVIDGLVDDWATVTPSLDAAGDVSVTALDLRALYVTTQASNGYLRVDVTDLQSPPIANPGSASLLEDGSVTITLTGSDPGGAPLTFQIATPPTLGTLGPITPIDATSASVLYSGNADEFGSDSFTFTVYNGTQTSSPATVAVTITPVNDAPSFTAADPPTVNEGSGANTVPGWASFDPGPANESSQAVLEYQVSAIGNPALFAIAPAVDASGTLTYTLAANASGSSGFSVAVRDDGGITDGGVDLSATQSFTLTVNAVNGAPSFVGGGDVSSNEDAGPQTFAGWATAIDDGDPDQTQTLTFNVTANTNPTLFASGPAVSATSGDLTYTTAADANGSATITLTLSDDGGNLNGGSDTSAAYQFTIAVTAVNDAPSFTANDPPSVNENNGAQSVPGWASFDPGPADESGQVALEYLVSGVSSPALFTIAPAVDANGTLTYTLAPDASGSSSFDVAVRDDGGIVNGGIDLSATQTFTLTVNSVNSAPSFVGGGDVTSDEDAGPQSFAAWATAISDGDPEVQTLTFNVTGNTNPSLFSAGPAVDAGSGTLSYTATANASGSATITLTLSDDGGGNDTSAPYNFTVTVNAVNDAPTATAKAHTTHSAIELEIVGASHTGELLEGATDADDPTGDLTAVYVAGSATPAGAQVTVTNASDGSFRYDPPGGASGAGSFQFQICDDGAPTGPQQCSAATTVSFTITGPELYFVDDSAAAGGDGGLNDPFDALSDIPAGRGNGDRIYVFEGTYGDAHALNADEHLIGQGHTGSSTAHLGVVAVSNGVLDTTPAAGTAPTLGNTVTFGGNSGLLRGVAISSGGNTGVVAGAVIGSTVLESSVAATTTAVNLNGTGASATGVNFTSTTSSGGASGIVLNNITGPFDFGAGSLSGNTGVAFLGTGTLGTASYAGSISKSAGGNLVELNGVVAGTDTGSVTLSGALACTGGCSGIDVVNRDAGTITFSGATKTFNTGASTAVNLDNNDGASIHFTGGGLDIDSTSGSGFNAVNGATAITVQGASNSIASTTGVALNVAGSTIGTAGLTFQSVAANGATSGIVLDGTGSGFLTVTGAGGDCTVATPTCTGGTIVSTTDDAVALTNANNVTLTSMRLQNAGNAPPTGLAAAESVAGDHAVQISGGSNVVLSGVLIQNPVGGGVLALNLAGSNRIDLGSEITGVSGLAHALYALNINVNNTLFQLDASRVFNCTSTSSTVVAYNQGTANMTFNVNGSTFEGLSTQALTLAGGGTGVATSGTLTSNVTNSFFRNGNGGGTGENNVAVLTFAGATHLTTVSGNLFDNIAEDGSIANSSVIRTQNAGGLLTATVADNTIQNLTYAMGGRHLIGHVFEPLTFAEANDSDLTFDNNTGTTGIVYANSSREGIFVDHRATASNSDTRLINNDFVLTNGVPGQQVIEFRARQTDPSTNNLTVNANTGDASVTGQDYLDIDAEQSATVNATVANNVLANAHSVPSDILSVASEAATSVLCADLNGNTVDGGTGTIELNEFIGATLNVEQASAATVASANGVAGANVLVTGTPQFGTANCPGPTPP